jgi:archaeosine-15-forming tRNA-guanine transglycosylase
MEQIVQVKHTTFRKFINNQGLFHVQITSSSTQFVRSKPDICVVESEDKLVQQGTALLQQTDFVTEKNEIYMILPVTEEFNICIT